MDGPASDADLPAWTAALGLPGLADVHVHFMPARVQAKVWGVFDRAEEVYGRPWPVTYREGDDARAARLRALGVRLFSALSYAHRPGMAAWLNDWSAAFAARTPGAVASATCYPEPGARDYLAAALDAGAAVVKLHVQVGDFDLRDPALRDALGMLSERGVPVVVHAGSGPLPGRFTGPGPVAEVLAEHPALRLVVAHMGAPEYAEFFALAERFGRVCLDTTMATTDFMEASMPLPRALVPRLRDLALAGKVALGSDFPSIPYPYAHQVAALARLGLGDDALRAVLWDTPAALLGGGQPGGGQPGGSP